MAIIIKVSYVESWEKNGKEHKRTHLVVRRTDGELIEATGYGVGYKEGDSCQIFFDDKWDQAKVVLNKREK